MPLQSPVIRPDVFQPFNHIVAGFTTRHGGVSAPPHDSLNLGLSAGDNHEAVEENRRRVCEHIGVAPERLVTADQVHGANVEVVDAPRHIPACDGLVTTTTDLLLAVGTADCAAVLIADPERGVVGACHSGWRGTVACIPTHTVEAMRSAGGEPGAMYAYISPCIGLEKFEVGPEVAEQFDAAFVHDLPGAEKPHVDLKAAIKHQLEEAGIAPDRIEVSPHCTMSETEDFYSYRAESGQTGRMLGFIGVVNHRTRGAR